MVFFLFPMIFYQAIVSIDFHHHHDSLVPIYLDPKLNHLQDLT
ncbi:hypothetical protein GJA_1321 [Janthinobacterium agaricidamnosum NBRC 102515 = DSM 9628]|uniref:Uncharacterized protein n=1 Tax=Janthinobacterium agaricidamnosum NBRC 102515 = DSM 9628 TaxID=1349767 RepID=W0UZI1_9BURK|nr:hypothetical protein GJA_1321 [Janthinobacterium agaricidamnosum NBRC 102515 = DSM 9628]